MGSSDREKRAASTYWSYQRESLELWMITTGAGEQVSTRPPMHPDEYHGKVGKPGGRMYQDPLWLEAGMAPDVQWTNVYLNNLIFRELPQEDPEAFDALFDVYLGPDSDPSLPEFWRRRDRPEREIRGARPKVREKRRGGVVVEPAREAEPVQAPSDQERRAAVERGIQWLLERVAKDGRLLIVPYPEEARTHVEKQQRKKRVALGVFFREREQGAKISLARSRAADAAKCSVRAVRKWTEEEARAEHWRRGALPNANPEEQTDLHEPIR